MQFAKTVDVEGLGADFGDAAVEEADVFFGALGGGGEEGVR